MKTIERNRYEIEIFPYSWIYTYQENIDRNKVEEIKTLYRSRDIFLAPPTVKWSDDETKLIIIDGNHRAVAMYELLTQEDYVATMFGLYKKDELGIDCGEYIPDGMLLAIVENCHARNGEFIQPLAKVSDRI